jgi:hypothetical protein
MKANKPVGDGWRLAAMAATVAAAILGSNAMIMTNRRDMDARCADRVEEGNPRCLAVIRSIYGTPNP